MFYGLQLAGTISLRGMLNLLILQMADFFIDSKGWRFLYCTFYTQRDSIFVYHQKGLFYFCLRRIVNLLKSADSWYLILACRGLFFVVVFFFKIKAYRWLVIYFGLKRAGILF